jgi:hypothetical protein
MTYLEQIEVWGGGALPLILNEVKIWFGVIPCQLYLYNMKTKEKWMHVHQGCDIT